jgi:hypothetical protein
VNKKQRAVLLYSMQNKRAGDNLLVNRPAKYVFYPLTRSRREGGHLSLLAPSGSSTAHLKLLSSSRRQRSVHTLLWRFTVQTVSRCCLVKDSTCVSILTGAVTLDQVVGQPTLESNLPSHKRYDLDQELSRVQSLLFLWNITPLFNAKKARGYGARGTKGKAKKAKGGRNKLYFLDKFVFK